MKKQLFMIAGAAALLASAVHLAGVDGDLENLSLDTRFRLSPDTASVSDHILIIAVDQASLESMNWLGWPWPRQIWSDITAWLHQRGASVVYFDITFPTSSTFSATEDSVFGAMASLGNTVFITGLGTEQGQPIPPQALLDMELPSSEPFRFASPPVADIAAGASLLAAPYGSPDPDGTFRKLPLLYPAEGGAVPSAALAIAMLAEGTEPGLSGNTLTLGEREFNLNDEMELQVRFPGPAGSYTTIPVGELLAAMTGDTTGVKPELFQDAVVLIGYTASDLMDLKPMPYSPRCPGVEVIAAAADNLLQGRYVTKPGKPETILLVLLAALATAAALAYVPGVIPASLAGLAVNGLYALWAVLAFRGSDLQLPAVPPLLGGLLTLLAGSVVAYRFATKEKRFLKAAFSQYLSPAVVAQVAAHPETLRLGGEKRTMTAFFSDVAGFTGISEKLDPRDLVFLLNTYLSRMTDIILESGGTVDKFEGDAIIAFWGAPVSYEDHAERGVRAALECQRSHLEMNGLLREKGFPELHTRIGLGSGPMVVGNMGSEKRFDYTIMGSDVNLASRLEGVNKVYGTSILVSQTTKDGLPGDIHCREVDTVLVVGQKKPVTIWEPVEELTPVHREYSRGLELYRNGMFQEALGIFSSHPDDPPSATMVKRCGAFMEKGTPKDWDGTWKLTSK